MQRAVTGLIIGHNVTRSVRQTEGEQKDVAEATLQTPRQSWWRRWDSNPRPPQCEFKGPSLMVSHGLAHPSISLGFWGVRHVGFLWSYAPFYRLSSAPVAQTSPASPPCVVHMVSARVGVAA